MKRILSCATVAGLLIASSSIADAKGPGGGASSVSPGREYVASGKQPTGGSPGASGYSPGDQYRDSHTTGGRPGASVYAPGFLK